MANRIADVQITSGRLRVFLTDGRKISSPLGWYPTLLQATPAERKAWKTCGAGTGVHWTLLDYHLSVEGLLRGAREARPKTRPGSVTGKWS